jgi:hypothetical protein
MFFSPTGGSMGMITRDLIGGPVTIVSFSIGASDARPCLLLELEEALTPTSQHATPARLGDAR